MVRFYLYYDVESLKNMNLMLRASPHSAVNVVDKDAIQGLGTIAQGVAQIGQAAVTGAQEKQQKFMDAAGNVYEVLTDATGAATNFVIDAAGTVFDTTKMAGGFLLNAAMDYPGDVMSAIGETGQDLRKFAGVGADAAAALGQYAMNARPELPKFKEMLKPKAWADAAQKSTMKMSGAFNSLEDQFMDSFEELEDQYCTPAKFTPSFKKPAEITMPGFYIEAGLGECTVETDDGLKKHEYILNCTKPYVTKAHVPGEWVSKRKTAIEFETKSCKIEKEIGEFEEIVLFEFDGHTNMDPNALRQTVSQAFSGLANGVTGVTDMMGEFMNSLKNPLQGKLSQLGSMKTPAF